MARALSLREEFCNRGGSWLDSLVLFRRKIVGFDEFFIKGDSV